MKSSYIYVNKFESSGGTYPPPPPSAPASTTVFLTKKIKINKRFCFKFKKKKGFDFENIVKSKPVKPQMPTLTPKISDLLFMT